MKFHCLCESDLVGKNRQIPHTLPCPWSIHFSLTASHARVTLPLPACSASSDMLHAPRDRDRGLSLVDIIILFLHCQHLFLSHSSQLSFKTRLLDQLSPSFKVLHQDVIIPGYELYPCCSFCPSTQALGRHLFLFQNAE